MSRGATSGIVMLCGGVIALLALAAWTWLSARPPAAPLEIPTTQAADTQAPQPASFSTTELEIAVEDAAAPWSRPDGTGCVNDIVAASYQAVGVSVKWKVFPYARGKNLVMNGQIVACVSMSWCSELEGKVVFPDADKPNFIFYATYVRNLKMPQKGTSEQTIPAGARIGTVLNYVYPKSVNELAAKGVIFEETANEITNLKKLAMGRLDYVIVNTDSLKTIDGVFAAAGVSGKVGVAFVGDSLPGYIGFSLAHPECEFARTNFNKGYDIISKNGAMKQIQDHWRRQ